MLAIFSVLAIVSITGGVSLFWYFFSRKMPAVINPSGILVHHRVEKGLVAGTTWATPGRFRRQIQYLMAKGYSCVDLEQRIRTAKAGEFALAFDDALACLWDHALPVLREFKAPATFFVVSDFVGQVSEWDVYRQPHMTREQIRIFLDEGFSIGSHSATHPDLTRLPQPEVVLELKRSKMELEDQFGVEIKYLSYPFGRFNRIVEEAAMECGYAGALTINHPTRTVWDERFEIPGNAVYVMDSLASIAAKAGGTGPYWQESLKSKIINRFASGTPLMVPHPAYPKR